MRFHEVSLKVSEILRGWGDTNNKMFTFNWNFLRGDIGYGTQTRKCHVMGMATFWKDNMLKHTHSHTPIILYSVCTCTVTVDI